jgi:hypothetical protein
MSQHWTEEQENQVIQRVINNHKNKTFDIYDEDDIKSEIWLIAKSGIKDFDLSKIKASDPLQALENFLNTHVRNRLANFYRDKRGNKMKPKSGDDEFRHGLRLSAINPTSLTQEFDVPVFSEDLDYSIEDLHKIFADFTPSDLELYYASLSNVNIGQQSKKRLEVLINVLSWMNKKDVQDR